MPLSKKTKTVLMILMIFGLSGFCFASPVSAALEGWGGGLKESFESNNIFSKTLSSLQNSVSSGFSFTQKQLAVFEQPDFRLGLSASIIDTFKKLNPSNWFKSLIPAAAPNPSPETSPSTNSESLPAVTTTPSKNANSSPTQTPSAAKTASPFSNSEISAIKALFQKFLGEKSFPSDNPNQPSYLSASFNTLKEDFYRYVPTNTFSGNTNFTSTAVGSTTTEVTGSKVTGGNVTISGNSLTTTSGNLTIGSTGGTTTVSDNLIVNGNVGIGTSTPTQKLEISGGHIAFSGYLAPPTGALTAAVGAAGTLKYCEAAYPCTYYVTFVTALGETQPGPESNGITTDNVQINLSNIPIGPAGTTARKIYRFDSYSGYLVTTINDNTTTTYVDDVDYDTIYSNTAMPASNSTAGSIFADTTRALSINQNGYIGIGIANPSSLLSVSQTETRDGGYKMMDNTYTIAPSIDSPDAYYKGQNFLLDVPTSNTKTIGGLMGTSNWVYTSGSGLIDGVDASSNGVLNKTGTTIGSVKGAWGEILNDGTITGFAYGVQGDAMNRGNGASIVTARGGRFAVRNYAGGNGTTGTITNGTVVYADINQDLSSYTGATGTITTAKGFEFALTNTAGGTITNSYGLYLNTPSNAGTITNHYGIYLANQTVAGTTNNYAIYSAGGINYFAGNTGIGTTTPKGGKLFVVDTSTGTTASASFSIRSSYTTGSVASISATSLTSGTALQIVVKASTSGGGNYLVVKDTAGNVYASLSSGGRFSIRRSFFSRGAAITNCTGVGSSPGCIDYAENFHTLDNSIEAGDVIALDPSSDSQDIIKAKTGDILIGVISSNPGVLLRGNTVRVGTADSNESITEDYNNGFRPVALAGRVPVKISFENGDIKKGDYLTSSSIPGKATKAIKSGRVIGISLESATQDSNKTQVMVLINPHWAGQELDVNGQLADFSGQTEILSSKGGVIASIVNYLKDAILNVKKLVAEVIESKKGFETYDKTTGEKYCVIVDNGQVKTVKGECDGLSETPLLSPEPEMSPSPQPSPETSAGTATPEPSPTPELTSPSPIPETPVGTVTPTPETTSVPEEVPPSPTPEPELSPVSE